MSASGRGCVKTQNLRATMGNDPRILGYLVAQWGVLIEIGNLLTHIGHQIPYLLHFKQFSHSLGRKGAFQVFRSLRRKSDPLQGRFRPIGSILSAISGLVGDKFACFPTNASVILGMRKAGIPVARGIPSYRSVISHGENGFIFRDVGRAERGRNTQFLNQYFRDAGRAQRGRNTYLR